MSSSGLDHLQTFDIPHSLKEEKKLPETGSQILQLILIYFYKIIYFFLNSTFVLFTYPMRHSHASFFFFFISFNSCNCNSVSQINEFISKFFLQFFFDSLKFFIIYFFKFIILSFTSSYRC